MNQNQLYPETLPAKTAQLVDLLQKERPEFLSDFYLSNERTSWSQVVYFEDAQQQPMPKMHQDVSWGRVKQKMIEVVKSIKFE